MHHPTYMPRPSAIGIILAASDISGPTVLGELPDSVVQSYSGWLYLSASQRFTRTTESCSTGQSMQFRSKIICGAILRPTNGWESLLAPSSRIHTRYWLGIRIERTRSLEGLNRPVLCIRPFNI